MGLVARLVVACSVSLAVSACGGGGSKTAPTVQSTLSPGATVTMEANSSVLVPPGTIVTSPNGTTVQVCGSHSTIYTQAGAVVVVPATESGAFDNVVSTAPASSNGTSTSAPTVTAIAGSPTARGTQHDGTGSAAEFWSWGHLALDAAGNVIVSDGGALRKVTQAGAVTTIAGPANFFSIAVSPGGDIYGCPYSISAISFPNLVYAMTFPVLTVTGTVQEQATWLPSSASSSLPQMNISGGLAIDKSGNFYYADEDGNRILKIRPGVDVTVFAGSGTAALSDGVGPSAALHNPTSLIADAAGNLIVNDFGNGAIRKISPDGTVTTVATTSKGRYIAIDGAGNIFVDAIHNIKRIDVYGNITTFPLIGVTDPIWDMVADQSGNVFLDTGGVGAQVWRVSF